MFLASRNAGTRGIVLACGFWPRRPKEKLPVPRIFSSFSLPLRGLPWLHTLLIALALAMSAGLTAHASDVELTLAGPAVDGETLELTMDDLEAMPQVTIVTESEFSDDAASYRGPLVRDLLARLGLDAAETIRLIAANDYFVDIPTSDFEQYDVVLALEVDGQRLSRREKGPLWLMYPISDHSELRSEVYNARLIWQVVRIEAL